MVDIVDGLIRLKTAGHGYHRMGEVGILTEDDRVEPIDGELLDMSPIGSVQAATVGGLNQTLVLGCRGRAIVSVQNPARLDQTNEPQPSSAVFRMRADPCRREPPPIADMLLIAEVADSSLRFDRAVKRSLRARQGRRILGRRSRAAGAGAPPQAGRRRLCRGFDPRPEGERPPVDGNRDCRQPRRRLRLSSLRLPSRVARTARSGVPLWQGRPRTRPNPVGPASCGPVRRTSPARPLSGAPDSRSRASRAAAAYRAPTRSRHSGHPASPCRAE